MSITVRPITPDFAAEIGGIDLREPLDKVTVAAIDDAINHAGVLVFHDQFITDEQQQAFSRNFGDLESTVRAYRKDFVPRLDVRTADISNLDERGQVLPKGDRRRLNALGNRLWHSDFSFKRIPARFSLLSARVIPGEGGETQFADMRAAWDALPDKMKRRLDGMICEHTQIFSRGKIGFTDWAPEELEKMAPVPQVLVRTHPGSGRRSLFLSSHAGRIRGMEEPEARLLLMDLIEHATQPKFVYTHSWRVGDLVMWDNRCTMHRAREYDETQVRDMHRTTVSDGVPTVLEQRGGVIRFLAALFLFAPGQVWAACAPVASAQPRFWRVATEDRSVTITFLGHASFLIETPAGVRAVTDYSGIFAPRELPDLVTMNHAHSSHYTLRPDPRIGMVLHGWQEGPKPAAHDVVLRDLRVTNLPTNIRDWNGGTEYNGNSVFIFELAGLCIAHLGHLHHLLEPADLDAMGHIDVVMVMVDGAYSIGQADARAVIEQIHPRVVLPMHYFTAATLARFLDMMRETHEIEVRQEPTVTISRMTLPDRPTVISLPGPH